MQICATVTGSESWFEEGGCGEKRVWKVRALMSGSRMDDKVVFVAAMILLS